MYKSGLKEKLRYAFDNTMAKGSIALIAWLGVLSLLIVLVAATVVGLFNIAPEGAEPLGFAEGFWVGLMRAFDAGNLSNDNGTAIRIVMLIVTLGGIFIVSALIGVISSGISDQLTEMRKGRSFVIEKGHTLILGWSPKIHTVISELIIANLNQRKPRIVILADKDKLEMEEEIKRLVPNTRNTKVICRSGNPFDMSDLHIANPYESKSIIILTEDRKHSDSQTIKTILALTNNPNRRKEPYHIVAEIRDPKNLEVAKMVGREELEAIYTDDLIARIMVQTCRQSGLSGVYIELLDFDGVEIYFTREKSLEGKTFKEAVFAYETSAVMGIARKSGEVLINPPMDTKVNTGDSIIAISEDDDTLVVSKKKPLIFENLIRDARPSGPVPEKTLLLGWNQRGPAVIRELNNYVAPGSVIRIVSKNPVPDDVLNTMRASLTNLKLETEWADTTHRPVLDALNVIQYEHIILLCYEQDDESQDPDSLTLITLLHLRNIAENSGVDLNIVSEMIDMRNRELAEVTKADDFIVSDKLISLMLSQVSENKKLMRVFDDLFDAGGSEIYLKPVEEFIATGEDVNFYTICESASKKGMIPIGYRIAAYSNDLSKAYGIVVNPDKSLKMKYNNGDKIIVISED